MIPNVFESSTALRPIDAVTVSWAALFQKSTMADAVHHLGHTDQGAVVRRLEPAELEPELVEDRGPVLEVAGTSFRGHRRPAGERRGGGLDRFDRVGAIARRYLCESSPVAGLYESK